MRQSEIVVEGENLTIGYQVGKKRTEVHAGLNFQLFRGELTCLLGANGAGKSTLLRTLAAAQPSLSGGLRLLGRDLSDYSERELSRTIGVVLTDRTQAGGLTVYELVALGRQPYTGFSGGWIERTNSWWSTRFRQWRLRIRPGVTWRNFRMESGRK